MDNSFKISIEEIVAKCPSVDAFTGEIATFIDAIEKNFFNGGGYDDGYKLAEKIRIKVGSSANWRIHTAFNIPHDSDECCSAEVLVIDGSPVALMKSIGDKSDYSDGLTFLNADLAKKLIQMISDSRVESRLKELTSSISSAEDLMSESMYITPVKGDVFVVNNPKWACSFKSVFDTHSGWIVDDTGRLHRVKKFNQFTNNLQTWQSKDRNEATQAIVEIDSGEVKVNAKDILFTLGKEPISEGALKDSAEILFTLMKEEAQKSLASQPTPRG